MKRCLHLLLSIGVAIAVLLSPASAGAPSRAAQPAVVDQHWSIVNTDPPPTIELRVLVVNNTSSALNYHVRFTAEWAQAEATADPPSGDGEDEAPAAEAEWKPVQIVTIDGGPVAGGASERVAEHLPADILQAPKAYRFRAELLEGASGAVLAETFVTKRDDRVGAMWLPAAGLAGALVGNAGGSGSSGEKPEPLSGSGTMVGTHEARRVGSEWVEHGSGVITVTGPGFIMVIDYSYDSHGPNAAALTAAGTGTGTITRAGRPPIAVRITSATADMGYAGDRQQSGNVVTRTRCTATGTFDGFAGDDRYRGTVTMTNGIQTLDLVTHTGDHRFDIQFNAVH